MAAGFTVTRHNLLLVEGPEDKLVMETLLTQLALEDFQVHPVGSVSEFGRFLSVALKAEGAGSLRTISLLFDADDSAEDAFADVRQQLAALELPTPTTPGVFTTGQPSLLLATIPLGHQAGALEDVVLWAIEDRDGRPFPCWGELRNCLAEELPRSLKFNESRWNKIRLQLILNCSERGLKKGLLTALQSREYSDLLTLKAFDPIRELLRAIRVESEEKRGPA